MGKTKKPNKEEILCPKCDEVHNSEKQFCQKCGYNIAYWLRTGKEYEVKKASCLPFTKGF